MTDVVTASAATKASAQTVGTDGQSLQDVLGFMEQKNGGPPSKKVKISVTRPVLGRNEKLLFHIGNKSAVPTKQLMLMIVTGPEGTLCIVISNTASLCQYLKSKKSSSATSKLFFNNAVFAGDLPPEPFLKDDWKAVSETFSFLVPNVWVHQVQKIVDGTLVTVDLKKKLQGIVKNAKNPEISKNYGFVGVRKNVDKATSDAFLACFERGGLTDRADLVFETTED